MRLFLLVCYLILTILMITVILFQRSEASAGLGGGTMGGMMTARGTANLLTRLTAVLAALFMGSNLLIAYITKTEIQRTKIQEEIETTAPQVPFVSPPVTPTSTPAEAPSAPENIEEAAAKPV